MRRLALPLILAATLLAAGCSGGTSDSSNGSTTAVRATAISGTVSLIQPRTLSDQAILKLKLVDVSVQPQMTLISKTFQPVGQLPLSFSLDYKSAQINPGDLYVVQARMVDGDRTFITPIQYPVLTKGGSARVKIRLRALPTPGEKALSGYQNLKVHLGAMKYTQGSKASVGVASGWQVFRNSSGALRFIRELEDAGNKGFTSTEIAYQDNKPWVVVKTIRPKRGAKPSRIEHAGWNSVGKLVLAKDLDHGKAMVLSAAAAKTLYDQGMKMRSLATKK